MATSVVTFDAGQTLVDLDLDFLAERLEERGIVADRGALAAAAPAAWQHYDGQVAAGAGHPWKGFMTTLLETAGARDVAPVVDWLWQEQPRRNLWRKPIAGMVEVARELARRGVVVAVLSNSEGGLADLLAEVGIADAFVAIVDSGRVGIEKPDPRIFAHALAAVGGGRAQDAVHIGDSWTADVLGAIGAGWRAVWYRARGGGGEGLPAGVAVARDAAGVRAALQRFGV